MAGRNSALDITGSAAVTSAGQRLGKILEIAQALPPEALINVINIAGDIARTNAEIRKDQEALFGEIEILRERNTDVHTRLEWLRTLLESEALPEGAKTKIVETICEIAQK